MITHVYLGTKRCGCRALVGTHPTDQPQNLQEHQRFLLAAGWRIERLPVETAEIVQDICTHCDLCHRPTPRLYLWAAGHHCQRCWAALRRQGIAGPYVVFEQPESGPGDRPASLMIDAA